jgi:pSer/pThr/pTyr-binding forkhead associated (FHA) protein
MITKAPDGRQIWNGVRDELLLNLYPLPFSTLAPAVYHIYLHPDDFALVEAVVPRIVAQVQRALTAEVETMNRRLARSERWAVAGIGRRDRLAAIEVPTAGWEVHVQADRNGELERGHLGIISTLSLPAAGDYAGTPTTRIVKSTIADGRRTSTTTTGIAPAPNGSVRAPATAFADQGPRARLTYEDEQGPHEFIVRKDSVSVGRGGSSAWVDVQIVAASKVSREHCRIRRDAAGTFFIQDVSLWGTSVDGAPLPAAVKTDQGVTEAGAERELPKRARIALADAVVMQFEALQSRP